MGNGKDYVPFLDLQAHVPYQTLPRPLNGNWTCRRCSQVRSLSVPTSLHGGGSRVGEFNISCSRSCGPLSFLILHPFFTHFGFLLIFGLLEPLSMLLPLSGDDSGKLLVRLNRPVVLSGVASLTHREEELLNPSSGRLPSRCGVSKYEAVPTRQGILMYSAHSLDLGLSPHTKGSLKVRKFVT